MELFRAIIALQKGDIALSFKGMDNAGRRMIAVRATKFIDGVGECWNESYVDIQDIEDMEQVQQILALEAYKMGMEVLKN